MKKLISVMISAMMVAVASGAGFGLYEMSAKATAMGGHVFGRAADASANYYNPATMSDFTGTVVTVGFSTLHPTLDTEVDGVSTHKMDPGCFFVPNAFLVQELPWDLTAGLGFYADYGLGSHYDNSWPLSWDSVESVFRGYTVNPNLSYRVTDRWSVAAGLRLVHASFVQRRYIPTDLSALGLGVRRMRVKFDVDNDVDVGWQLGTRYQFTDSFSMGAVYRSRVRLDLEGDSSVGGVPGSVNTPIGTKVIGDGYRGDIGDKLDLPMNATVGANWDIIDPLHFGASLTWTEWSCIDTINFMLPAGMQTMDLRWHDAYRTGFGFGYDVTDDFTALVGYTYDWDPTREKRPATMLPAGDRHIVSFGGSYALGDSWEISVAYALIIMESKSMYFDDAAGDEHRFRTDNSYTHCVCVTLSYIF